MRKTISLILSVCLFFSICIRPAGSFAEDDPYMLEYAVLTEPSQQEQIEQNIYSELNNSLKGEYLIDIQAFYESKEAIEEGLYNSRESEYFGYLLSEVDAQFQGVPYVFTMDESGSTIVQELVPYDDLWGRVLKNVAIGTGVILVCVTVSSLTAASAPAIHLVFACAAEQAVEFGVKGAAALAIKAVVSKYAETGDIQEALKCAALDGSEGFKWGALGGAITGSVSQALHLNGLKRATNMSMDDIAQIKMSSSFTDDIIKKMHSIDEFQVYQDAKLIPYNINGRTLLIPKDMDWNFVDPATGLTNRQLIHDGLNPVDQAGLKYEWHHIGQKTNSPLALLTQEQHRSNSSVLHVNKPSEVRPNGDNSLWLQDKKDALRCLSLLLDIIL